MTPVTPLKVHKQNVRLADRKRHIMLSMQLDEKGNVLGQTACGIDFVWQTAPCATPGHKQALPTCPLHGPATYCEDPRCAELRA